ncbi:MAG: hypothetical protein ACI8UO_005425 [Verrucomicrobiales bacterium]|jgi:hypothetical protein
MLRSTPPLLFSIACLCIGFATLTIQAGNPEDLPLDTRFKGQANFEKIVKKAKAEDWASLPIGDRIAKFAHELRGLPYISFSLEIDDHIEAPSANLDGLDCWTFFEIALGLARMVAYEKDSYSPQDLLDQIEFTRYRAGSCSGHYLERIHYLGEWFFENEARGVADDFTRTFDSAVRIQDREVHEMTNLAKHYRYLRENPELVPKMAILQEQIERLPVYFIPKDKVAAIEGKLQDGDIIGIATRHDGGFCSHVGLAMRTDDGVMRLMHATTQKQYRKVIIDDSISEYLARLSSTVGIIVARPLEVDKTVHDSKTYRKNLAKLTDGVKVTFR